MSTSPILDRTAPIYRRTMPPETQILPAIHALSARDFNVCENCGGPAMLHPKFEMAQIVAGEKAVLCCACLHQAAHSGQRMVRLGDQLWRCCACGFVRAWGWMNPWDSGMKPALGCEQCDRVTRHRFVRVA